MGKKGKVQKAVEKAAGEVKPIPKRQIVIETDGSNIDISKNECSNLELQAILNAILRKITEGNR